MVYRDFEVDLTDLESVVAFITKELAPFNLTLSSDTRLRLTLEAGKDKDGVTVHRPWARMSALLSRAINTTHLNEGEGAKFRGADATIRGWLEEQAAIDATLGIVSTTQPAKRTGSRSISVRSYF